MQWGKKRWGTMPYHFQQHYFFLSKLTIKNFRSPKIFLIPCVLVGPPLLLPIYFHVEVLFYVLKKRKWIVSPLLSPSFPPSLPPFLSISSLPLLPPSLPPSLFNCYCVNIFSSGFRLHADLLHDIPLHVLIISRWLLAKLQILFLHQVYIYGH